MSARQQDEARVPNRWGYDTSGEQRGGQHYVELVEALRGLQDLVVCSDPSPDAARAAAELIGQTRVMLGDHAVEPGLQYSGLRGDVVGRAHPLIVPVVIDSWDRQSATGSVSFTEFYVGGGTAVHGGAIALAFDEVLGRLTNSGPPSRTAYLHVDYRKVVPVGRRLEISARCTARRGRKIHVAGRIALEGEVLAAADGLWVILRPEASARERGELA